MDTEILIVGAGPTGLMLANQLVRRGLRPTIIDRHSGPAQQTRAMAVHARTLEIYAQLGVADDALALGRRGYGANMWAEGQWRARIPLTDIGQGLSPYPYVLMLGQDDNEKILGAALNQQGVKVQWNTELIALEQDENQATATIKQPDGSTRKLTAAYIAGCDGGHSAVRELNHIGFPGAPYEHVFFVADTEAVGSMKPEELNVYLWREGFHLFFPMRGPDRWRVIGILPKRLRQREDLKFEELVPAIQQEAGTDLTFKSCSWFSTYRISHRCAERFRSGRCFLLGDAAHVHSPAGGQGMNTGLQDAYNLGWKLALVLRRRAQASLLDSYEADRLPVARQLLRTTDRAFIAAVSDTWLAGLFRTRIVARIVAFAMRFERIRKFAFRTISQIGIRYPDSPLSRILSGASQQLPGGAPQPGDRFPWLQLKFEAGGAIEDSFRKLDDRHFNLLVIGQRGPAVESSANSLAKYLGLDELLKIYPIPDEAQNAKALATAGVPNPSFYLLRPDGHVGLAGIQLRADDLRRYFSE